MQTFNVQAAKAAGYSDNEIVDYLAKQPRAPMDVKGALKAGYSPAEITNYLATLQKGSDSLVSALESGAGNAVSGLANVAGDVAARLGYKKFANAAFQKADDLQAAGNFTGHPLANLKTDAENVLSGNNILQNVENAGASLANLAALNAPSLAAGAAASAIPVVGPAAGAAYFGANAAGNTIQDRMDAANEAAPSNGDLAAGAANGVVQGALGELGLGKMLPGVGSLAAKVPGVARAATAVAGDAVLPRLAGGAALAGAAGGIGGAANYVADTAGIGNGPTLAGVGNAAATGAAGGAIGRLATLAPGSAVDAVRGDPTGGASLATLASRSRVANDVQAAKTQLQNQRGADNVSDREAIATVHQRLRNNLTSTADALVKEGVLTKQQKDYILSPAIREAAGAKTGLGEGEQTDPTGPLTSLQRLQELDLPGAIQQKLSNGLRDLDTISQAAAWKPSRGPFEEGGRFLGKIVGATATRGLIEHIAPELGAMGGTGLAEDLAGYALGEKLGAGAGRAIDSALNFQRNPLGKEAQVAQRRLAKLGIDAGPSSIRQLQDLQDDAMSGRLAPSDLPPVPPAPGAAPAAPQAAPQGGLKGDPLATTLGAIALAKGGVEPTQEDFAKAIGDLHDANELTPAQTSFYAGNLGSVLKNTRGVHNENLTKILKRTVANLGGNADAVEYNPMGATGGPAQGIPNGGERPVLNLHQWSSAKNTYQAHAQELAALAERQNMPELAAAIHKIAMTPEVSKKNAAAKAYLDSLGPDIRARLMARQFLNDRLLNQGKR